jgi:hypothetical protein
MEYQMKTSGQQRPVAAAVAAARRWRRSVDLKAKLHFQFILLYFDDSGWL